MSFLGDALGFEAFHAKDLWKGIKKNPKRLVLGVDPLSTKAWNGILGRKDKPLVDQFGGAYGGHTVSAFGANDGGVYKRAREAGIDTGAGENMQDAAHVIAAIYGGKGLMGIGGGGGAPTGNDLGVFSNGGQGGMSSVGQGNVGQLFANTGFNTGGVQGVGGTGAGGGLGALSPTEYAQMGQGLMGGQQQQQPANKPNPIRIWTDPRQDYVNKDQQKIAELKRALMEYQRRAA